MSYEPGYMGGEDLEIIDGEIVNASDGDDQDNIEESGSEKNLVPTTCRKMVMKKKKMINKQDDK